MGPARISTGDVTPTPGLYATATCPPDKVRPGSHPASMIHPPPPLLP